MGTSMTAMLVDAPGQVGGAPGVTATITRGEIEEALASDEPLDLILDVARPMDGGVETTDVRVTWQRGDLESLLARMDADAVLFSFDRSGLERAVDPDFEGHGIREALLLTVAAASASAAVAVSTASGQLMDAGGGGAAAAAVVPGPGEASTARDLAAGSVVVPGHDEASTASTLAATASIKDEATLAARGVGQVVPGADEATLAARGVESVAPAVRDEATLASRGIDPGTLPASHDEATLAARGVGQTMPGMDEATLTARGIEAQPLAATHDEATLAARGVQGPPVAVDSGSSLELPSVDSGTAAAIGGLAGAGLVIAAAAFAARRNRVGTA